MTTGTSHPGQPTGDDYPAPARAGTSAARVRLGAKALVVVDDRLLVTVNDDDRGGEFWLLPGGGVEFGESTAEALVRECLEEASLLVTVGELACVRDYVGAHHEFAEWDSGFHQVDLMFWCTPVDPAAVPAVGAVGDTFQTGVRWVPLAELADAPLWPAALKGWLAADPSTRPVYLGDVN